MTYLQEMDAETGLVDAGEIADRGTELRKAYNAAEPFPHVVIDDFLPQGVAERCLEEMAAGRKDGQKVYNREQERLKREYRPDELSPWGRNLFYAFNSRPFIQLLENITGIEGLIPDPYFSGAGFHETDKGGHLSVHADFNHHKRMDLERRINLLVYLNRDWDEDCGGQLELWDNAMERCVHSVVPVLNRCVIFNTTSHSNHGHPQPVNHPQGASRKSIALYYYTATWGGDRKGHSTVFRTRPGTGDRTDWPNRRREFAEDWLPPIVRRGLARVLRASKGRG